MRHNAAMAAQGEMMIASQMTFEQRLKAVQDMFTGQPVQISGGNRPPVQTVCLEVKRTENENVDFICENQARYGMRLSANAILTEQQVLDKVSALNQFIRTVTLR